MKMSSKRDIMISLIELSPTVEEADKLIEEVFEFNTIKEKIDFLKEMFGLKIVGHDGKDDGLFFDFRRECAAWIRDIIGRENISAITAHIVHRPALDPDALTQFLWIPCHVVTHRSVFCRYGKAPQEILKTVCVHHALQKIAEKVRRNQILSGESAAVLNAHPAILRAHHFLQNFHAGSAGWFV